ncbi:MAG: antitoxin Xre/MbcA/ParS toxin-binding domain-containing protein [Burkholderiaceae bacterium]|jgi:putative toxin-antitoxin system antitoxin component (TIGR02293 family)|nr:antitoxin Xre/MbcA/ParS toxin-binding domain-containing protein [Burkholderiaceae bacterium]
MASKGAHSTDTDVVADQIKHALGMRSLNVRTAVELHDRIAQGLPRSAALRLVLGLKAVPLKESLRALRISRRTWDRFKAEPDKPLDVDQSARVWRMAEILVKAEEVLGTQKEVQSWLTHQAIGLGSRRPTDLMITPQGAEFVVTLLERMKRGVYS